MPSFRIRMHIWNGGWATVYTGAEDLAEAVTLAVQAIEAEDPHALILDEVLIKRMTPRNADGSWGQAVTDAAPQ